ncbi:hypothetical protein BC628DRAFT_1046642 [Trametes gibbosa]|nr:hypothetical protein BC628DRAFT_1046642 [Trametes gibbosa]
MPVAHVGPRRRTLHALALLEAGCEAVVQLAYVCVGWAILRASARGEEPAYGVPAVAAVRIGAVGGLVLALALAFIRLLRGVDHAQLQAVDALGVSLRGVAGTLLAAATAEAVWAAVASAFGAVIMAHDAANGMDAKHAVGAGSLGAALLSVPQALCYLLYAYMARQRTLNESNIDRGMALKTPCDVEPTAILGMSIGAPREAKKSGRDEGLV